MIVAAINGDIEDEARLDLLTHLYEFDLEFGKTEQVVRTWCYQGI